MTLQIYSNSDAWLSSLLYTSISGVVAYGMYYLYESFIGYIEKINKIQNIQKKVSISEAKILVLNSLNNKIEKKISELEMQIEILTKNQINQNKSFSDLSKKTLSNEKLNPDYALIGYVTGFSGVLVPFFIQKDFDFKPESIKKYFKDFHNCCIIIDYLKNFKNIREINLFDLIDKENNNNGNPEMFISGFRTFNSDFNFVIQSDLLLPGNRNYNSILSSTDFKRDRYINWLRKLRSLLEEINIKLILNEDFENFIR